MKSPLTPISSVLENLFKNKKSPFSEIYFLFQLNKTWKQLAGDEISSFASPVHFKNQELTLVLPDSTHLQEMHFVKETLRKKINKKFSEKQIKKIVLKVKNL